MSTDRNLPHGLWVDNGALFKYRALQHQFRLCLLCDVRSSSFTANCLLSGRPRGKTNRLDYYYLQGVCRRNTKGAVITKLFLVVRSCVYSKFHRSGRGVFRNRKRRMLQTILILIPPEGDFWTKIRPQRSTHKPRDFAWRSFTQNTKAALLQKYCVYDRSAENLGPTCSQLCCTAV